MLEKLISVERLQVFNVSLGIAERCNDFAAAQGNGDVRLMDGIAWDILTRANQVLYAANLLREATAIRRVDVGVVAARQQNAFNWFPHGCVGSRLAWLLC